MRQAEKRVYGAGLFAIIAASLAGCFTLLERPRHDEAADGFLVPYRLVIVKRGDSPRRSIDQDTLAPPASGRADTLESSGMTGNSKEKKREEL